MESHLESLLGAYLVPGIAENYEETTETTAMGKCYNAASIQTIDGRICSMEDNMENVFRASLVQEIPRDGAQTDMVAKGQTTERTTESRTDVCILPEPDGLKVPCRVDGNMN